MNSQEAIKPSDALQEKAVLVIPNISNAQLDELKAGFENYWQVEKAVYVYKNHNCLLIDFKNNSDLKFYTDLLKIIKVCSSINTDTILIKTPLAYLEILGKDDGDNIVDIK
jgi:hypothetical protein